MSEPDYQIGDLLHYIPHGERLSTKSAIFVGKEHIYYEMALDVWDFDAVITLLDDGKLRPVSLDEFSAGGTVNPQRSVPEAFRIGFAEYLSIYVESKEFANCRQKDFAWTIMNKYKERLEREIKRDA